jgi:hypothetical protein
MKVGDLVRYKHDPASNKVYLVATLDSDKYQAHDRYATLVGWAQTNCVGTVQRFRIDSLEMISASR